jgi:hypothetical protein
MADIFTVTEQEEADEQPAEQPDSSLFMAAQNAVYAASGVPNTLGIEHLESQLPLLYKIEKQL